MTELVPRRELEMSDSGSYLIPAHVLREMSSKEIRHGEELLDRLPALYPGFKWRVDEHHESGGIAIWWKRDTPKDSRG